MVKHSVDDREGAIVMTENVVRRGFRWRRQKHGFCF
jgi:hypothetical protein